MYSSIPISALAVSMFFITSGSKASSVWNIFMLVYKLEHILENSAIL